MCYICGDGVCAICDACGKELCQKHVKIVVIGNQNMVLGVPTNSRKFSTKKFNSCPDCYGTVDWTEVEK